MTGFPGATLTPLVLAVSILTLGCDGAVPIPPSIVAITKISGDEQNAVVGQTLTSPIRVEVTEGGAASGGTTVEWATTTPGGSLVPSSGPTDADGAASTVWTLGTTSGTQRATAMLSDGSLVSFTATAAADAATTLIKAGGDGQTGEIGRQLAVPVQARVTDQHGNGVQGVAVGWTVTGGAPSSPSVISDAAGLSLVNVTLGGSTGPIVITATAAALGGSPLTFNATAVPVTPAPVTANVTVSNNLFSSNRNTTTNPAVDTVAVNGTVTWTWVSTALTTHSVASEGSPSFTSSALLTGPGESYSFQFLTPGSYEYTCAVHPTMTGRIVVR